MHHGAQEGPVTACNPLPAAPVYVNFKPAPAATPQAARAPRPASHARPPQAPRTPSQTCTHRVTHCHASHCMRNSLERKHPDDLQSPAPASAGYMHHYTPAPLSVTRKLGVDTPAQAVAPQGLHLGRQLPEQPPDDCPGAHALRPPLHRKVWQQCPVIAGIHGHYGRSR